MSIQKLLGLLGRHCKIPDYDYDYGTTLGLIASASTPDRMQNHPGWYLVACGGHQIKVHEKTFANGDITAWDRKTPKLPQTNESYAAGIAMKYSCLVVYLSHPENLKAEQAKCCKPEINQFVDTIKPLVFKGDSRMDLTKKIERLKQIEIIIKG
jgi:hypothetical protein